MKIPCYGVVGIWITNMIIAHFVILWNWFCRREHVIKNYKRHFCYFFHFL